MFGLAATTAPTTGTTSIFGQTTANSPFMPGAASTPIAFGTQAAAASSNPPAFGATTTNPVTFGPTPAASSLFSSTLGQTTTSTTPGFGLSQPAPTFGTPSANSIPFGTTPSAATSLFSSPAATTGSFGAGLTLPTTSTSTAFGTQPTAQNNNPPAFGASTTNPISFGTPTPAATPFSLGQTTTTASSGSGLTLPTTSTPVAFGTQPAATSNNTPAFGATTANPVTFGTPSAASSLFSSTPAPATTTSSTGPGLTLPTSSTSLAFGAQPTTTSATPAFGASTTTNPVAFGTPSSTSSLFPSTPAQSTTTASSAGLTFPPLTASASTTKSASTPSLFSLTATPGSLTAGISTAGATLSTGFGNVTTTSAGLGGLAPVDTGKIIDMNSFEKEIGKLVKQTERQGHAFREMVREVNGLDTVIRSNSDKLKEVTTQLEAFDNRATNLDYGIAFVNDQLLNLETNIQTMEEQLKLPSWTEQWSGKGVLSDHSVGTPADAKRKKILQLLLALDANLKNTTAEAANAQRDASSLALQLQGGQKEDEKALALVLYKQMDMLTWIDKMNDDIENKLRALEGGR